MMSQEEYDLRTATDVPRTAKEHAVYMRDFYAAKRAVQDAERANGGVRTCIDCGETKPWTMGHFGRRKMTRKDGSQFLSSWYKRCRPCQTKHLFKVKEQSQARKAREKEATPPVAKALAAIPMPMVKPPTHNFRTILLETVGPEWKAISRQLVKLAKEGDKQAIRLIASYALGTPRELEEDTGASGFWNAILAAASHHDPGADADPPSEGGDLELTDDSGG